MNSLTARNRSRRRSTALAAALLTTVATTGLAVVGVPAAQASIVIYVADWTTLSSYAGSGDTLTVALAYDISGAGITLAPGTNLTLDLNGYTLSLTGGTGQAGVQTTGAALTVIDTNDPLNTGTLNAAGGDLAAGIGGGNTSNTGQSGGTITIGGGTVNATGGGVAAGIGGGGGGLAGSSADGGDGGVIAITGGTVNATGGGQLNGTSPGFGTGGGAGIGAGSGLGYGVAGSGGQISISGGIVNATGGDGAAGIGGSHGPGGTISISNGIVTALGGFYAAGIGGGGGGTGGIVTVSGGNVHATGGSRIDRSSSYDGGAGIGGGSFGPSGSVTIDGGFVTAIGGAGGAGIGSGERGTPGTVTIGGGNVTATGGNDTDSGYGGTGIGAGVGTGSGTDVLAVTITGGSVAASGGHYAAGIGGAAYGPAGSVTIDAGTVVAVGGDNEYIYEGNSFGAQGIGGAGIGGGGNQHAGSGGAGGPIVIGPAATASVTGGPAAVSAIGANGVTPTDASDAVTNHGHLRLNGTSLLSSPLTNGGTITVDGEITGGTITNDGTILTAPGAAGVDVDPAAVTNHDYHVTYDTTDAGVIPPTAQRVLAKSFEAGQVTMPTAPSGYRWMTARSGGVEITPSVDLHATFGGVTDPTNNFGATEVALYAEPVPVPTHTVSFDATNGSAPTVLTVNANTAVSRPAPDPTRTGYTFGDWWTSADDSGAVYNFATPVTADLTLYAHWTPIPVNPCANLTGLQLSDGLTPGSATTGTRNTNGTWSFSVKVLNCTGTPLSSMKILGGTAGWTSAASAVAAIGRVTIKSAKPGAGQVVTWDAFALAPRASATVEVTVTGAITKTATCGSTVPLAGNWSATGTAGKKSYTATTSKVPTITVTC